MDEFHSMNRWLNDYTSVSRFSFITIIVFLFIFCYSPELLSQNVIVASGGNSSGSGGAVSYTLGQVVYTPASGTGGNALQGIQLPYEVYIITSDKFAEHVEVSIIAYPNPVSDYLILITSENIFKRLSYKLFDINGKLVLQGDVRDKETRIPFGNFTPGHYILMVLNKNIEIRTFKIIKY